MIDVVVAVIPEVCKYLWPRECKGMNEVKVIFTKEKAK